MRIPSYDGNGLVNLAAELEHRLTGASASPRLATRLRPHVPEAGTYVLVLIDGLGDAQLGHPAAAELLADRRVSIDAPFPTQTSVATSTLATGLPPSQHGLVSYLLHLGDAGVVNTLFWYRIDGGDLELDPAGFLPSPNSAERLAAAGRETVVIEPAAFVAGALDRVLYRGARVRGTTGIEQAVEVALEEAAGPGRLVVVYFPHVDAAAHIGGQGSAAYAEALFEVGRAWRLIANRLPEGAALIGTADHGHVDVRLENQIEIPRTPGLTIGGDSRVLHIRGPAGAAAALAGRLPATLLAQDDVIEAWGPGPRHPEFESWAPETLIAADDGYAFTFPGHESPMTGHHGGLSSAEVEIPLLAADPPG